MRCSAGNWCALAATTETACVPGTYSNALGLTVDTECYPCAEGFVCEASGITDLTGLECPAEFYCGSAVAAAADAVACEAGKYCPANSIQGIPCVQGTYQPDTQKDTCIGCEQGFFCDFMYSLGALSSQKVECLTGHECPDLTMSRPNPCGPGYYQDTAGL